MYEDKEKIEAEVAASQKRTKQASKQFIAYTFEYEAKKQVTKMKKKLDEQAESSDSSSKQIKIQIVECDNVFVHGTELSVGSIIKSEASHLRKDYNTLDANNKAIVALGLNSIIDLSFDFPDVQSTLFNLPQWCQLRKRYKLKKYDTSPYEHIKSLLEPIFRTYNNRRNSDENWNAFYKKVKDLETTYDPELDVQKNDVSFCIFFILQVLLLIKHQPALFSDSIDSSEWDFVVKFWGVVTERLFYFSGLRLKWGDTHLTLHDTVKDLSFKVDMRILHDRINQRYNVESEVGVAEAAEEDPGYAKFTSDRCKVLIENKAVVDRYLMEGCFVDSVDSLQICGLEVFFINLALQDQGLYVGTQFYYAAIDNSLENLGKYINLAINLLCFRDNCLAISNKYERHLVSVRSKKKSAKRCIQELSDDELSTKQSYIRDSWNPPRSSKTPPLPEPKNFYAQDI